MGGGEGDENKLSPQVIFSLLTSPTTNYRALLKDGMGLSGAKRQLLWQRLVGATFWDGP